MSLPYLLLTILWLSLIAYAVLGGADFGAGFWEPFSSGPLAQRRRDLINQALGPVWEANHVWIIFLVVGLFSAFPTPFAALVIILFIPLTLALLGIVLRGSAFVFRTHGLRYQRPIIVIWSRIFSFSSIMTPFFLGLSAAAVASGRMHPRGPASMTDLGSLWLTPFALVIGCMSVAVCATLSAVYLTVEATNKHDKELAESFRWRGLGAAVVTDALAIFGLALAPIEAPILWRGMLNHAWPLVLVTFLIGVALIVALVLRYYQIARMLVVGETAFLLGSWGVSQIPYLIPPDVTVDGGAGPPSTLHLLLIGFVIGMIIVLPSIWYLLYVFKLRGGMGVFERGL
jgi:cytochrome d ubiquinol oxidase subunit II